MISSAPILKIVTELTYLLVITMYSSHVLLTITLLLLYLGAQNFIHYTEDHVNEYRIKKKKKMDGWMNGWMDGWMDGLLKGWNDGWMGGWIDGRMDGWIYYVY